MKIPYTPLTAGCQRLRADPTLTPEKNTPNGAGIGKIFAPPKKTARRWCGRKKFPEIEKKLHGGKREAKRLQRTRRDNRAVYVARRGRVETHARAERIEFSAPVESDAHKYCTLQIRGLVPDVRVQKSRSRDCCGCAENARRPQHHLFGALRALGEMFFQCRAGNSQNRNFCVVAIAYGRTFEKRACARNRDYRRAHQPARTRLRRAKRPPAPRKCFKNPVGGVRKPPLHFVRIHTNIVRRAARTIKLFNFAYYLNLRTLPPYWYCRIKL